VECAVTNAGESIADMVSRIAAAAQPARVILFGSYARNEADPDSDVDLLVLFDRLDNRRETVTRLYSRLIGTALPKDIVVATVAEYERYCNVPNTTFYFAARQGRTVYAA
jgi:predicted nucleotidyltransferase